MLKHVKLFEGYMNEVTAQITGVHTTEVPTELADIIKLSFELHTQLDAAKKTYENKLKEIQPTVDKYDAAIMKKLVELNSTTITVGGIITRLMKQAGKITNSYKTLWGEALKKVNAMTKKILLELQEAEKKQNADKFWLTFEKPGATANESVGEFAKKFAKWVSEVWNKLKDSIDGYIDSAKDLEKLAEELPK